MKVLAYLPIDTIVKTWARRLEADGHEVETTCTFSAFVRRVRWADWVLANATKNDAPRYVWKLLVSLLWARLIGRRVALFISIDLVDLCDRPLLRAVLWVVNWVTFHCAALVVLLATREHVARRYRLPHQRLLLVYNCPDRTTFKPPNAVRQVDHPSNAHDRPLTFFYHGEMLWWHGLERFLPIYEEIRKRRPARLIVAGNFYPSVFRVFGLAASRREAAVKHELEALLRRDDVEHLGRVPIEQLQQRMADADFHVSLLNDEDVLARTELRTCLLEAMAAGMVCLHAPTPGLAPDVFRDGENIVFVNPRDPTAAERILALADSAERCAAIRRNAVRTIAEHFDMDREYAKAAAMLTTQSG
jgi:glycosyltransferase involved in cell wall biosynthesis